MVTTVSSISPKANIDSNDGGIWEDNWDETNSVRSYAKMYLSEGWAYSDTFAKYITLVAVKGTWQNHSSVINISNRRIFSKQIGTGFYNYMPISNVDEYKQSSNTGPKYNTGYARLHQTSGTLLRCTTIGTLTYNNLQYYLTTTVERTI